MCIQTDTNKDFILVGNINGANETWKNPQVASFLVTVWLQTDIWWGDWQVSFSTCSVWLEHFYFQTPSCLQYVHYCSPKGGNFFAWAVEPQGSYICPFVFFHKQLFVSWQGLVMTKSCGEEHTLLSHVTLFLPFLDLVMAVKYLKGNIGLLRHWDSQFPFCSSQHVFFLYQGYSN